MFQSLLHRFITNAQVYNDVSIIIAQVYNDVSVIIAQVYNDVSVIIAQVYNDVSGLYLPSRVSRSCHSSDRGLQSQTQGRDPFHHSPDLRSISE